MRNFSAPLGLSEVPFLSLTYLDEYATASKYGFEIIWETIVNLPEKKALVTGADGFIGSHLVEALLAKGCDVRAFVYYNSFNSWGWLDTLAPDVIRELDVFPGDIRDPHGVFEAMKGCDIVFHLAALIAIPFSYHSPDSYVDTNIRGH